MCVILRGRDDVADQQPRDRLEVRTTSGGLPTATVLATTTLAGFSSGSSTFYSAVFTEPAILTAGTTYAFTIHSATTDPVTRTFAITYALAGQCFGSPGHQVLPPLAADGSSV
jgi:hypothetical protein